MTGRGWVQTVVWAIFGAAGLFLMTRSKKPVFIRRSGQTLTLNGQPFRFVGVNRYNLLTVDRPEHDGYRGCGNVFHTADLSLFFQELSQMGVKAIRFWAFQRFTASGMDFRQLDTVLSLALRYRVYTIPVLENQWDDCTEGGYKYANWYRSGYRQPYGAYPLSYRDYVGRIVSRYRSSPAILTWQLMNEAESTDNRASNDAQDPQALYDFASDMSGYVKSLDPNHLVSLGTMGGGQPGTQGDDYARLHALPAIDLLEYHDYSGPEALPGDLSQRVADASFLNKPLFIGEAGLKSGCVDPDCYSLDQQASLFDAKINAAFGNGVAGYVIWSYRDSQPSTDYYQFGPGDPLAAIVQTRARQVL